MDERSGGLDRTELARRLGRMREDRPGLRVVVANGCFDLLHVGHLRFLADARSRGDVQVVAHNTDVSVRALKGEGRPLVPFAERAELLLGLSCVDFVVGFDELTLERTLRALRPDVHAKGTDYAPETLPERWIDEELGIEIAICGDEKSHSATALVQRLAPPRGDAATRS